MTAVLPGGSGGSLTPPVTLEGEDPNSAILTVDASTIGQNVQAFRVLNSDGDASFESGGPAGNKMTGSNPNSNILRMLTAPGQVTPALTIVDADDNDCFTVGGFNGVTLSADAVTGFSELQITNSALTFRDELGGIVVDIEGGFTNLGPGGEVSITTGTVYVTLPTSPGPSGSLYNSGGFVKVAP